MPEQAGKACKHCGQWKRLDQYYAHPNTKDRKQVWCIACQKAKVYEWRLEHRGRYNEIARKSRAKK